MMLGFCCPRSCVFCGLIKTSGFYKTAAKQSELDTNKNNTYWTKKWNWIGEI